MKNACHYCTVDYSFHVPMLILLLFFTVFVPQVYAGAALNTANQAEVVSQPDSFRIMSFNIRYGSAKDKENAWDLRKDLVFDIINEYQAEQLANLSEENS